MCAQNIVSNKDSTYKVIKMRFWGFSHANMGARNNQNVHKNLVWKNLRVYKALLSCKKQAKARCLQKPGCLHKYEKSVSTYLQSCKDLEFHKKINILDIVASSESENLSQTT